ncbi:phosphoenolpyruvate--protein phosphotransferase [uncultured Cohaesibacter sp.]|uniref:phosphoenolpyruvate--protein phosphotransferase n=1 Tax=uncultured Cohaesibacter sp. TaxID=1002546 RepID=UPI0029C6D7A6|nr:phosphoenolpyruvate--protein phosphotransferase [uncultured Cohaesibacter sp.]
MTKSLAVKCLLPNGLHARPASRIEELCNAFTASMAWHNARTGRCGNAKSALSLIGTDTLVNDDCLLTIEGSDEDEAFATMERFFVEEFPHCDEALPTQNSSADDNPVPRCLSNLDPDFVRGSIVSEGIGKGRLIALGGLDYDAVPDFAILDCAAEQKRLDGAIAMLSKGMIAQQAMATGPAADILAAHLSLIGDCEFLADLSEGIRKGLGVVGAVKATGMRYCQQMRASSSPLIRERELDIRDLSFQILDHIYGETVYGARVELTEASVCFADELTPSRFLELDRSHLKALLLGSGGTTSHTVILARSFGIPTLVGMPRDKVLIAAGEPVIVDASIGLVIKQPDEAIIRHYDLEFALRKTLDERLAQYRTLPAVTQDGYKVEIAANIALPIEAKPAFAAGAEGIGLFRTEMLYMDRVSPPTEDELYNAYVEAIEAAKGRPIIVRTIDVGGDKPVDYLEIPKEHNPFLGYRAVRIYAEYIDLFRVQLRSILRASAHGPLKIMIPMISSFEEILWVKEVLGEVKRELRDSGIAFREKIPFGIMLEVPSIAYIIDQCAQEVDFFSIGSNDLTQYLLAVDRDNDRVSKHYNSLNPAFIRALDRIVQDVHANNSWIGLCGELGGKGSVLPLLVGLGLDEISMSAPAIAAAKARLAKLSMAKCRQVVEKAKACRTALEVDQMLAEFRMGVGDAPMVSRDCVVIDEDLRSKNEIIKRMTDQLLVSGRCRYPARLADDVWAREDVFSTALGFGFAIPHAKSEHIEQSSISIAKLPSPVIWGEDEVDIVIMLTLNKYAAGDLHLNIFSRLARKIMNEDFRAALRSAPTIESITAFLQKELELT